MNSLIIVLAFLTIAVASARVLENPFNGSVETDGISGMGSVAEILEGVAGNRTDPDTYSVGNSGFNNSLSEEGPDYGSGESDLGKSVFNQSAVVESLDSGSGKFGSETATVNPDSGSGGGSDEDSKLLRMLYQLLEEPLDPEWAEK